MPQPKKIMLFRHAERPAKVVSPYCVTVDGHTDVNSLSATGWQRALASCFAPAHSPLQADDLVWAFDWNSSTSRYDFTQIPHLLLSGDRKKVLKVKKTY